MPFANMLRLSFWLSLLTFLQLAGSAPKTYGQAPQVPVTSPPPASTTPASEPSARPAPAAKLNDEWGKGRLVGAHRFPSAVFIPSVLVTSSLGVRAGVEYHQVPGYAQLPTLGTSTKAQAVDLKTINVAETIDFAFRLHEYIAVFGDFYGRARLGANISTLLGTGADYTYGGDVGALVKLLRFAGFQLGARAQVGYYTGQSAGILTLFQDLNAIAADAIARVQRDPNLDLDRALSQLNSSFRNATADLLTPFDGVVYAASLNVAQGIGAFVGIQGSVGFSVDTATYQPTMFDPAAGSPRTTRYKVQTVRPNIALAVDLDLEPIRIPIDIMLEYRIAPVQVTRTNNGQENDESSAEQLLAFGLYYSGRSDLQLGVTGYTLFGQPPALGANAQPSGEPQDLGAQFVFRYFW